MYLYIFIYIPYTADINQDEKTYRRRTYYGFCTTPGTAYGSSIRQRPFPVGIPVVVQCDGSNVPTGTVHPLFSHNNNNATGTGRPE